MDQRELLTEARKSLERLTGYTVDLKSVRAPSQQHDVVVTIRTNVREYHLPAELVRAGSHTTLTGLITRHVMRSITKDTLLITDYVSPKNAEVLRQADVQYLDASGNCRIESSGLSIHIQGQRRLSQESGKHSAFRKSGLKVIFALLVNEDLKDATYRDLAQLTGVSRGTVGNVMKHLEESGLVQRTAGSKRRIKDRDELINRWVTTYGDELKPALLRGRFEFEEAGRNQWRSLAFPPDLCQWGGEPAAAILTDYLKPAEFILYSAAKISELAVSLRLRASKQGEIVVLERFWDPRIPAAPAEQTVHPLLVYADLVTSGDPRNLEVAKMIYDSRLSNQQ